MATATIGQLTLTTVAAAGDLIEIETVGGLSKRIAKSDFIGAALSGGGIIATGGFTLAVPASGAAALKTGTPVAGHVAGWADANTLNDGGFALSDIARLSVGQTYAGANIFTAAVTLPTLLSQASTINTDNVFSYVAGAGAGLLFIAANSDSTCGAVITFRAGSSPYCVGLALGSQVNVTTGILTGITGVSGKLTVSTHTDGRIYVENRRPTNQLIKILLMG